MAGSVNKVILVGNLGKDPEARTSQAGDKIVSFSLATSESWKDKTSGERREKTEWHRVVIFNPNLGDVAERYLRKGSKVYVEGQLRTRKYTDTKTVERTVTEVVIARFKGDLTLLDGAGNGGPRPPPASGPEEYGSQRSYSGYGSGPATPSGTANPAQPPPELDDQIPF